MSNATHIQELVKHRKSESVRERIWQNLEAVGEQLKATKQSMFPNVTPAQLLLHKMLHYEQYARVKVTSDKKQENP